MTRTRADSERCAQCQQSLDDCECERDRRQEMRDSGTCPVCEEHVETCNCDLCHGCEIALVSDACSSGYCDKCCTEDCQHGADYDADGHEIQQDEHGREYVEWSDGSRHEPE